MKAETTPDESATEIVQSIAEQAKEHSQEHDRLVDLIGDLEIQAEWFSNGLERENAHYQLDSIASVCLYKFARGMSFTDVVDFIATTGEASQFDLPTVPTQQAVHYAWRNRFDSTGRSVIRRAALRVRFVHEFP
ncbi:hypothetical protein [Haloarcula marina]|uniref:hypothetical protein n=1 Tax=Haloarcula marina TaxID=2961574 RepID=UPI0020B639D0|nr:hypothetical protein [Halomicroarcula marina]